MLPAPSDSLVTLVDTSNHNTAPAISMCPEWSHKDDFIDWEVRDLADTGWPKEHTCFSYCTTTHPIC